MPVAVGLQPKAVRFAQDVEFVLLSPVSLLLSIPERIQTFANGSGCARVAADEEKVSLAPLLQLHGVAPLKPQDAMLRSPFQTSDGLVTHAEKVPMRLVLLSECSHVCKGKRRDSLRCHIVCPEDAVVGYNQVEVARAGMSLIRSAVRDDHFIL
jgi:hypothetical protein